MTEYNHACDDSISREKIHSWQHQDELPAVRVDMLANMMETGLRLESIMVDLGIP